MNRRDALAATGAAMSAALGSLALSTSIASATAPAEAPIDRVNRLARELAMAMDTWMDDVSSVRREHWVAHIHPASARPFPIAFEDVSAPAATTTVRDLIRTVEQTISDLNDASDGIDKVAAEQEGRRVTFGDWRRWAIANRAEREAIIALCGHKCGTPAEYAERARYLLMYDQRMNLQPEHITALLESMT